MSLGVVCINLTGDVRVAGQRRGLGDVAWSFAREFSKLGDDVHFVSSVPTKLDDASNVTVHTLRTWSRLRHGRLGHLANVVSAFQIVRRLKGVQVIYTPEVNTAGPLALISRIPIVHSTANHTESQMRYGFRRSRVSAFLRRSEERLAARRCMLINSISSSMTQCWSALGASPDRIVQLPHGVELDHFSRRPNTREKLGIASDEFVILCVGRLSAEKNFARVVEAVALLPQGSRSISIRFLGDGPMLARLRALCDLLGVRGYFHGWASWESLPSWYSAADVCVLPSLWEPMGRVMLETLSCGTPFVGSSGTGMADYITHGETGLLCDAYDSQSIAGAIDWIRSDPSAASKMGEAAAQYAREAFTWPLIAKQLRIAIIAALSGLGETH